MYHVDTLSLYYLHHPVVHKHDFYNLFYPLFQPLRWVSSLSLILPHLPPYHFPDLSSSLCLKCTMYIVFICNSHSLIVGQPIKTTYSGKACPNYIVHCDFVFVLSRALYLNKNMKMKWTFVNRTLPSVNGGILYVFDVWSVLWKSA